MRHIYRYTEQAKKHLSSLIKSKMPKSEPWLHVAVKTWSNRNPWSGIAVYVWDTRQVIWEHRCSKNDIITNERMKQVNSGMNYAVDNRQPLVGGRKDINEFFEFGEKYDASNGSAFDGKDRVQGGNVWKNRSKLAKPAAESIVDASEIEVVATEATPSWSPSPEHKQAVANAICMYKKVCTFMTNIEKQIDVLEKEAHDMRQKVNSNVERLVVGKNVSNYAIGMQVSEDETIGEVFDRLNDKLEALKRSFRN